MTFTLEELKEHFGGDWLIGRVTKAGKGFAYVQAYRENGEPWRYPDGILVNDILVIVDDDRHYQEKEWVLIRGYEINDGSDPAHRHCRIRAKGDAPLLEEIGKLENQIPAATSKELSNAIYNIQVIGERILAMRSFLEKERQRIEREVTGYIIQKEQEIRERENELEQREKALVQRQEAIEHREKELDRREEEILREYDEVENLRRLLLQPKPRLTNQRAPFQPHEFGKESELLEHVKSFIAGCGFCYEEWTLENFFTCLKTDWLVILAGLSGSGKSRLPRLFAEAIGGVFELIPVRPQWNDDRDLLGFFNLRTRRYESTRFLEFLLQANEDRDRMYIVCLDEMNLAPVEYYFAQLLSALETEDPRLTPDETLTEEVISRLEERAYIQIARLDERLREATGTRREAIEREIRLLNQWISDLERYREVPVPPNVRFVGTVNIDHTTHGFSDKVIDRTNVIQFERVDLQKFDELRRSRPVRVEARGLAFQQFSRFCEPHLSPEQERQVREFLSRFSKVDEILGQAGIHLGLRVYRDVERYMSLAIQGGYFPDLLTPFDFQIKQRVLPKIRGMQSEELRHCLDELRDFLKNQSFSRSLSKVERMRQQLQNKGYVNYWEV